MASQKLPTLPLWEERWPQQALINKKKATSVRAFQRGFHLQPFADGERKFPSFRSCFVPARAADFRRLGYPTYAGVDLAGKTRPGNAIVALAVDPNTRIRHVVEALRGNWSSPTTAQMMAEVNARNNLKVIFVENNAYQVALVDWIRTFPGSRGGDLWTKVEEFTTGRNKADPMYGIGSLEVEFQNHAWAVPELEFRDHETICDCGWCILVKEMTEYPQYPTSDLAMGAWFARQAVDKYGGMATALRLGDLGRR